MILDEAETVREEQFPVDRVGSLIGRENVPVLRFIRNSGTDV